MRKAFTLLELLVVIGLIGAITTMILPRLKMRKPNSSWSAVVQEINNLMVFARQEAITNHKEHRLTFKKSVACDSIVIECETESLTKKGHMTYQPITSLYATTKYELPPEIRLERVYLGKKDLLADDGGAHCYIVPDGLIQNVFIWMMRQEDRIVSKVMLETLSFMGECKLHNEQRKPE